MNEHTSVRRCMEKLETQNKTVISHIENWFNEIQKKLFILNFAHSVASSCVNRVGILFCVQIKAEKFNTILFESQFNENLNKNKPGKVKRKILLNLCRNVFCGLICWEKSN